MFDLTGRVAVVTGASSGLGVAMAKALAKQGAEVAVLARRKEKLDEVVSEIEQAGGKAFAVACDVTKEESVVEAAKTVKEHYGKVDILINKCSCWSYYSY